MAERLEAIKGGGGSIRVGTTGRIGALMTRELDSLKSAPSLSASSTNKAPTESVSVPCGVTTSKILKPRKSLDEASSSSGCGSTSGTNPRSLGISQKTRSLSQNTHKIPMLGSDNIALDGTPARHKTDKGSSFVEVVDVRCGNTEGRWAKPIKNRLKKLNFSKLSESTI